ncbi:hypothetical protein [Cystobacter ferrugineus]|uniref:Uncharacterized protein n=1 Tax=Cystobacter ferrugineus TaxID=83449 RepID=A0A1L9BD23_9BACT|nr:hypothetical protein [Cystobacter ferrugineus]OJH40157.1 hypothetical protein BON30_13955 [Cystobacter ferrugineus]
MIVTLDQALFDGRAEPLLLISLLRYGLEGRHILLTDPSFKKTGKSQVNQWLAQRDEIVREAVWEALDRGLKTYPNSTSRLEVHVSHREHSDWHKDNPQLSVQDAALLLATPLRLVLEDRLSDKHFLLCIAPAAQREFLQKALARGWCHIEHGGGLENMKKYLASIQDSSVEGLRSWFMFDRDTQPSGEPSDSAKSLQTKCENRLMPHHPLERRSIENYLPPQALHKWVNHAPGPTQRKDRQKKVEHVLSIKPTDRQHVSMKDEVSSSIADLFLEKDFPLEHHWFVEDGQKAEIDKIMRKLFERM